MNVLLIYKYQFRKWTTVLFLTNNIEMGRYEESALGRDQLVNWTWRSISSKCSRTVLWSRRIEFHSLHFNINSFMFLFSVAQPFISRIWYPQRNWFVDKKTHYWIVFWLAMEWSMTIQPSSTPKMYSILQFLHLFHCPLTMFKRKQKQRISSWIQSLLNNCLIYLIGRSSFLPIKHQKRSLWYVDRAINHV